MGREAVRLVTTGKGQRRLAMILHNYKTTRTTLAEKSKDRRAGEKRRGGSAKAKKGLAPTATMDKSAHSVSPASMRDNWRGLGRGMMGYYVRLFNPTMAAGQIEQ